MQMNQKPHNAHHFTNSVIKNLSFATSLMLGIAFAYNHHWLAPVVLIGLLCLSYMCLARNSQLLLIPLLFIVAYARLQQMAYHHQKAIDQISTHMTHIGTIATIEKAQNKQYRYTLLVNITHYVEHEQQIAYAQPWRLQCYTKCTPKGQIDDTIKLDNIKISTKAKSSFSGYLKKEGLHATTFLSWNAQSILHHPTYSLARTLHQIKYAILDNIRQKSSMQATTLISTIFFGNRLYVKQNYLKLKDLFCNWGIIHFLARSGIHLIIFVLFLQFFLGRIPAPFLAKQIILLCLTGLYTALSWQSISFARAYFSFVWYKYCHLIGLQINMIHIITMLGCLFLLFNPMLMFFLDFQLSFGITLVLAITNHYATHQKQAVL